MFYAIRHRRLITSTNTWSSHVAWGQSLLLPSPQPCLFSETHLFCQFSKINAKYSYNNEHLSIISTAGDYEWCCIDLYVSNEDLILAVTVLNRVSISCERVSVSKEFEGERICSGKYIRLYLQQVIKSCSLITSDLFNTNLLLDEHRVRFD